MDFDPRLVFAPVRATSLLFYGEADSEGQTCWTTMMLEIRDRRVVQAPLFVGVGKRIKGRLGRAAPYRQRVALCAPRGGRTTRQGSPACLRYSSSTGIPHSSAAPNSAAPIGLSSRWSMPRRSASTDSSFGLLWASTPFGPATPRPSAK